MSKQICNKEKYERQFFSTDISSCKISTSVVSADASKLSEKENRYEKDNNLSMLELKVAGQKSSLVMKNLMDTEEFVPKRSSSRNPPFL